MTYVMYNFDLGYVQGMSDLLSPILYVMKNEVDAFWCFVGFMDRVASNFEFDQGIVDTEIILEKIIGFLRRNEEATGESDGDFKTHRPRVLPLS